MISQALCIESTRDTHHKHVTRVGKAPFFVLGIFCDLPYTYPAYRIEWSAESPFPPTGEKDSPIHQKRFQVMEAAFEEAAGRPKVRNLQTVKRVGAALWIIASTTVLALA